MDYLNRFEAHLDREKKVSKATLSAYMNDIEEFEAYIKSKGKALERAQNEDVKAFIDKLERDGRSSSTVNRKLASLRAFYAFMKEDGRIGSSPVYGIKTTRVERENLEYLSTEEVEKLLAAPDDSDKGLRDRALLELMYATGLKASEVCDLKIKDINFNIGYVNILDSSKPRVVPVGKIARAAIEEYLEKSRPVLLSGKEDNGVLFLSYLGEKLTRQGIWKILKYYAAKAEIKTKISPQILRNSFAAHLIQNGADLKSLQELLGHEDITATKIYLSVTKNRIMDVYGKAFPRA